MSEEKLRRSLRVNLDLTPGQQAALEATIAQYAKVFELHIGYYNAMKWTSATRAQEIYQEGLELHPLPSALFQTARDQASESLKAYHSRFPSKKWTKSPVYRARSARYDVRTVSLRGNLLSFSTARERVKTLISLPDWWTERYPHAKFKSANIGIDKNGQAFAQLVFLAGESPAKRDSGKTVGLDRGIKNIVYTSDGVNVTGTLVRRVRRQHLFNRKSLQQKGTRSARKRLRKQAGREARFVRQVNHEVSKWLASQENVATYVLEDLSFSRRDGVRKEKWKKKANKRLSDWSHAQLLEFLEYKCAAVGISIEFVDPAFTSQDCSRCKYRSRSNRVTRGRFECRKCGFSAHADGNAALNIRDKYLSSLTLSVSEAGCSEAAGLLVDLWTGES